MIDEILYRRARPLHNDYRIQRSVDGMNWKDMTGDYGYAYDALDVIRAWRKFASHDIYLWRIYNTHEKLIVWFSEDDEDKLSALD